MFATVPFGFEASAASVDVGRTEQILDSGCGIGSLEERFTASDIVGLERSEGMIRAPRRRSPAPFVAGDARELRIRTSGVDAVVLGATLWFIPEADAVIDEATRVVAPGGSVGTLGLNTRSEHVQSNLQSEGSYFQKRVDCETQALVGRLLAEPD